MTWFGGKILHLCLSHFHWAAVIYMADFSLFPCNVKNLLQFKPDFATTD